MSDGMMRGNSWLVEVLRVYLVGSTSRDVARGKVMTALVDWILFCCICRWPLLLARYLGRCFVMSNLLRLGPGSKVSAADCTE